MKTSHVWERKDKAPTAEQEISVFAHVNIFRNLYILSSWVSLTKRKRCKYNKSVRIQSTQMDIFSKV